MKRHLLTTLAFTAAALSPAHATSLFAIGGSPPLANQLQSVTTNPPAVAPLANISGPFSVDSLATGPGGVLYGFANDLVGPTTLYRIQPDGTLSLAGAEPPIIPFLEALTYDPVDGAFYSTNPNLPNLYRIVLNASGSISSVSLAESGLFHFFSLAFDTTDGTFRGIDDIGNFDRFDLIGNLTTLSTLPNQFFQGLTYDAANDVFWAVDAMPFGTSSELFQISPTGAVSGPFLTFDNEVRALAVVPDAAPRETPEPAVTAMLGVGLIVIGLARGKTKS
jgi:hypothetical protein